jgi:hypothetical protein
MEANSMSYTGMGGVNTNMGGVNVNMGGVNVNTGGVGYASNTA